jgi:hypothetical protein
MQQKNGLIDSKGYTDLLASYCLRAAESGVLGSRDHTAAR